MRNNYSVLLLPVNQVQGREPEAHGLSSPVRLDGIWRGHVIDRVSGGMT